MHARVVKRYIDRSYPEYLGVIRILSNMDMRLALSASSVAQMELSMAYPLFAFAESYVL